MQQSSKANRGEAQALLEYPPQEVNQVTTSSAKSNIHPMGPHSATRQTFFSFSRITIPQHEPNSQEEPMMLNA
jgi:hypothetical protein